MTDWNALAAIATSGATATALATLVVESRRTRRAVDTQQATLISSWIEQSPDGPVVVVCNKSSSPIFSVESSELSIEPNKHIASLVAPEEVLHLPSFYRELVDFPEKRNHPINYIDAQGTHWTWWGAEGVPGDPDRRGFNGSIFQRRSGRMIAKLQRDLSQPSRP